MVNKATTERNEYFLVPCCYSKYTNFVKVLETVARVLKPTNSYYTTFQETPRKIQGI